jgi:hypothetical protein
MLTDAQKLDCRRWMGYPTLNAGFRDIIFTTSFGAVSITDKLANLTDSEETVLIDVYLTPLAALEAAILTVGDNLDTDAAAVWKRNVNEQSDRERLFDSVRRRMCAFLGFKPGPELGCGSSLSLVRA